MRFFYFLQILMFRVSGPLIILVYLLFGQQSFIVKAQQNSLPKVSYTISPVKLTDRTNLKIEMSFDGAPDGKTVVLLPQDLFGTPRVYEAITSFVVTGGNLLPIAPDAPLKRVITHSPNQPLRINYTVSWDPSLYPGYSYRPSVDANHFHFFGSQWMVRLEDDKPERRFTIRFMNIPEGWEAFSNLAPTKGEEYSQVTRYGHLSGFIAGGDYFAKRGVIKGKPVAIYVRGDFSGGRAAVAESIYSILLAQRRFFEDYDQPYYLVSITERSNITAGTELGNSFACLADPKFPIENLKKLIAHETFHNWLPGKAGFAAEKNDPTNYFKFDWFEEGFTEYAARQLLLNSGAITREQLIAFTNKDLFELAKNPHATATFEEIATALREKKYMSTHERLSYLRGPLLALNWDLTIKKYTNGKQSVIDLVREFIREARRKGGKMSQDEFFTLAQRFGVDARADWERYMIKGQLITPNENAFGAGYCLVNNVYQTFDAGFDIWSSRNEKKIVGLIAGGNADKSGLSNGMKLISVENDSKADQPIRVVVEIDGQEKVFSYFPRGKEITYKEFRRRS